MTDKQQESGQPVILNALYSCPTSSEPKTKYILNLVKMEDSSHPKTSTKKVFFKNQQILRRPFS